MRSKLPDIIDNKSFLLKDAINLLLKKSQLSKIWERNDCLVRWKTTACNPFVTFRHTD